MTLLIAPALADGGALTWKLIDGARVNAGDVIAEIETAAAVVEVTAPARGFLASPCLRDGDVVAAGELIGLIAPDPGAAGEITSPHGGATVRLTALRWDESNVESARAEGIAASFRDLGRQLHPIFVRLLTQQEREQPQRSLQNGPDRAALFKVVAGCNRCAAAVLAQWPRVLAEILPCGSEAEKLACELIEIDENLQRKALTPAGEAMLLARRKVVYEKLYPGTRAGIAGGLARQALAGNAPANDKMSFAESAGRASGRTARTVQRAVARAQALGEDVLNAVKGTALDAGAELDALAELVPERRGGVIERARNGEKVSARTVVKQERRAGRERALAARMTALPAKKYGIIYCDLARRFNVYARETGLDRSPDNHYPTMTFDDALRLDVRSIAAEDAMLVYWSTPASLIDDIEIMAEWGFVALRPRDAGGRIARAGDGALPPLRQLYRSMQVWNKGSTGLGYWFRGNDVEFLLIGARGDFVAPAPGTQPPSSFAAPRGRHSEKPDHPYEWIERLWPTTPKVELFARGDEARPGWDAWGYEAPQTHPDDSDQGVASVFPPINRTENGSARASNCDEKNVVTFSPLETACCARDDHDAASTGASVVKVATDLDIPQFLRRPPAEVVILPVVRIERFGDGPPPAHDGDVVALKPKDEGA